MICQGASRLAVQNPVGFFSLLFMGCFFGLKEGVVLLCFFWGGDFFGFVWILVGRFFCVLFYVLFFLMY